MDAHDESGILSEESDFYGDEAVKQDLEHRAKNFSAAEWWKKKNACSTEVAISNEKKTKPAEAATLYNPYEGQLCGRQLGETVEAFLQRLPPSTTMGTMDAGAASIPWIFITNPFRKPPKAHSEYKQHELANEGPPDEKSAWGRFVGRGGAILDQLTSIKNEIQKNKTGQAKATITKAINTQKEAMVQKLLDTAVELHCTSGKWMMFCETSEVDAFWSIIAHATASNDLGIAAKVAPRGNDDRQPRLICIYTKDFTDMNDVARVISKMRDLGLVNMRARPIYYKCDAYTYLGLTSGNEYNIRASLYNSSDILKAKDFKSKVQKLDGFLYKKKPDVDWSQLE